MLIIKWKVMHILSNYSIMQPSEEDMEGIIENLRLKPYKKLLNYAIRYPIMNELCERIVEEILSCTLKPESEGKPHTLHFKQNFLHKDLLNSESLWSALKFSGSEFLRFLNHESFSIE